MKIHAKIKKAAALLAACAVALFSGCNDKAASLTLEPGQTDTDYIISKGTLTVGVTDFMPMDYREGDEWTGFDAELATAFAEELGVKAEFKEIDWDKKTELLQDGEIDCIWNGMTDSPELRGIIACSDPYLLNSQVIITRADESNKYATIDSCQHLLFAVEEGSTGEALLKEMKYRFTPLPTQSDALESVHDKSADAAVTDVIMASSCTGSGHTYEDLTFALSLNDEKLCVGFRADSDLAEKATEFLKAAYSDGTIPELADKYSISDALLKQDASTT